MKNFLSLTVFLFFLTGSGFAQDQGPSVAKLSDALAREAKSLNPEFLLFSPKDAPKRKIPLLIYLHGAGGVGDNIQKLRGQAGQVWRGIAKYKKGPCFVVSPQAGKRAREDGGWVPKDLNILLAHLKATLKVDEKRIYLTGNSMGGYGSWIWGGNNPEHFAAIAPVSGGIGPGGPKDVTPHLEKWAANLAKVPVMAFVGGKDKVVPAERSQRMIAAIEEAGGKKAKIRIYPDEGHGAGRIAFGSAEFYEWMFSLKRDLLTINTTPGADDRVKESTAGFKKWDSNNDGFLVRQEVPEGPRKIFDQVDRDRDGKVTLQEHLLATTGQAPVERETARENENTHVKRHVIRQKWPQEPDGEDREYFVSAPVKGKNKLPVVFLFHGNGGQAKNLIKGWSRRLKDHIVVAPQGYRRSWNISDESSRAPDTRYFRHIIRDLGTHYPRARLSGVSMIGFSNGAGYIFRLLIEVDAPDMISNAVPIVSSMVTEQYHDGTFWKRSDDGSAKYDTKGSPVTGSNILTVHGTRDRIVPYQGGKRGRNAMHLSAQDTAYHWAQQKGFKGKKIPDEDGREISLGIICYAYGPENVTHLKVVGAGHDLGEKGRKVDEMILDFIREGKIQKKY